MDAPLFQAQGAKPLMAAPSTAKRLAAQHDGRIIIETSNRVR
jgi:hypothetical protein